MGFVYVVVVTERENWIDLIIPIIVHFDECTLNCSNRFIYSIQCIIVFECSVLVVLVVRVDDLGVAASLVFIAVFARVKES